MIIDPTHLLPPRPRDQRFSFHNFNHSICYSRGKCPWPWTVSWARVSQRWLRTNIRTRQAENIHFPSCTLGPFGNQGNRSFPMVSGNAMSMLLAVTISLINKFTSCFLHFTLELLLSLDCLASLLGVLLDIKHTAQALVWLLVLFCGVGLVLPAAPAAATQAGKAAGESSS